MKNCLNLKKKTYNNYSKDFSNQYSCQCSIFYSITLLQLPTYQIIYFSKTMFTIKSFQPKLKSCIFDFIQGIDWSHVFNNATIINFGFSLTISLHQVFHELFGIDKKSSERYCVRQTYLFSKK